MEVIANLNNNVKVKLTNIGIERLVNIHNSLNEVVKKSNGIGIGEWKSPVDKDGYYTTQLWSLIHDFGDMIGVTLESPFNPIELIISARR